MSLDPPQGQTGEDKVLVDLPEYLGFAVSQMPFEDIPEEPRSSWYLTEAVEEGSGRSHWFITQTCFSKNHIGVFWYDEEAIAALIRMAQAAATALQQKKASLGGLLIANEGQMKQTVEGLEATKRNLLHMPGN